jgi:hypothetical protein
MAHNNDSRPAYQCKNEVVKFEHFKIEHCILMSCKVVKLKILKRGSPFLVVI